MRPGGQAVGGLVGEEFDGGLGLRLGEGREDFGVDQGRAGGRDVERGGGGVWGDGGGAEGGEGGLSLRNDGGAAVEVEFVAVGGETEEEGVVEGLAGVGELDEFGAACGGERGGGELGENGGGGGAGEKDDGDGAGAARGEEEGLGGGLGHGGDYSEKRV